MSAATLQILDPEGRLVGPDGVIRIGYAGQNGHGYTAIGALMRQRGLIGSVIAALTALMTSAASSFTLSLASGTTCEARNRPFVSCRETRSFAAIDGSAV